MRYLESILGKTVEIKISGLVERVGVLIDYGLDVVVIHDGVDFVYIPSVHIQKMRPVENTIYMSVPSTEGIDLENNISYRNVLMESKGMFVQIFVTGNQSIHGYITSLLTDYFVFFSPVHKTLFVPLFHLKWLTPYPENKTPYTLQKEYLPVNPTTYKLARTFEEQVKKMEGKIVVFDLGNDPQKIGLLKSIQNNMVELITADNQPLYWNINHLKMIQCLEM